MKTAKVFSNGRSLAVRIPKDWLGGANEVEMERVGDSIQLRPCRCTLGEVAGRFRADPVEIKRLPQTETAPRPIS